ncbi:hypothetical protein KSP39_PZI017321 [Platanthera zijinensis]|uniref:Uncharacterized protein n=1 Tax=Platanthera zijinensis TaxID=2320716 RepID=A0AAP0B5M7_9ASPA
MKNHRGQNKKTLPFIGLIGNRNPKLSWMFSLTRLKKKGEKFLSNLEQQQENANKGGKVFSSILYLRFRRQRNLKKNEFGIVPSRSEQATCGSVQAAALPS